MFNGPSEAVMETILVHEPGDRLSILEKQVRTLLEWQRIMIGSSRRSCCEESPASIVVDEMLLSSARYQEIPTNSIINLPLQPKSEKLEKPESSPALQVLDILERYGHNTNRSEQRWLGKFDFMLAIQGYVDAGKPVRMILPAFPFKSPNKVDKVLSALPDLGEELALAHLNGLCETITEVYKPGAEITILSDGLVYSDILGVPDEEVWEYGESLREMAVSKGLQNIRFARIGDVLGIHHNSLKKDEYTTHASCYRRELIAKFGDLSFDVRRQISDDKDTCMTYRGYLKFLAVDLKRCSSIEVTSTKGKFKKYVRDVAIAMIVRGKIFAKALQSGFSDYVRLSIHPSIGRTKLPIQLIPQSIDALGMTPWHCSIAVRIDGSYRTVHAADVALTHDLVHHNGRPYCFREKSDLYNWGETKVSFEHLYPCGLIVRPSTDTIGQCSLRNIDMAKLRALAEYQSPIIARGFAETTDLALFTSKAREFGKVVSPPRGMDGLHLPEEDVSKHNYDDTVEIDMAVPIDDIDVLQETTVKDEHIHETSDAQNRSLTFRDSPSARYGHGTTPSISPLTHAARFVFSTYTDTPPAGSGYTLFATSRLFFQHLPFPHTAEELENVTWRIDDTASAANTPTDHALIVRHPVHKTPCLHWHDQWSASSTQLPPTNVSFENASQKLARTINQLLCDRRVCLRLACEKGDLLVYDSVSISHTEAAGACGNSRGFRSVHVD
ncbi:hypothetical protein MMC17_001664 [Xylographa soralifera]|nr:hypothetical protein [Xylographa soralifera]